MKEEELIVDYFGNPIGKKVKDGDRTIVTDYVGNPLGYAGESGTTDYVGNPISSEDIPDFLLEEND